ncbi:glycosyltransferase [Burkholderia sp. L27(2015)]|uniref:glycosyltransferase n=1 Tax=Burkholderia sp. L27(2015) TaxID=1641858 RepID=UPI00131A9DF7|nr:glycosyltransferase [Burkholderia sp. L27(2015)]
MRVLHVCDFIDPSVGGGTAERTFQMARSLIDSGNECSVLTTNVGLGEIRRKALEGIDLHTCRSLSKRFVVPLISAQRVQRLVEEADIIHTMGHWSVLNAMVCSAAQRLGKPYVVCPAGALEIFGRSGSLKRFYNALVGYRMIRRASLCFAVTRLEIAQFLAYGVHPAAVVVVPNGIDDSRSTPRGDGIEFRRRHQLEDVPFLLFLGRLDAIKGPDLLMGAFLSLAERFADYQIVFAGPDGGMREALEQRAAASAYAKRIRFIGYIEGEEKGAALTEAELLVVPSRREAMSLVALEAGVAGTPVLLTDQCGFDEVSEVGGGRICSPSAESMSVALTQLLAHPELLPEMGKRLRCYVNANYTWSRITARCLAIYKDICRDKQN